MVADGHDSAPEYEGPRRTVLSNARQARLRIDPARQARPNALRAWVADPGSPDGGNLAPARDGLTNLAAQLVGQLGNGPGLLSLDAAGVPTAGNLVAKVLSDEPSREAAEALMTEGSERAALMTSKYRDPLLRIANGLCESDELEGEQIKAIVAEYADITERRGPVRTAPILTA